MDRKIFSVVLAMTWMSTMCARRRPALRVVNGITDTEGKYPYVVSLLITLNPALNTMLRVCTGTLISLEWVITAAHCLIDDITHIQYGNMSVFASKSQNVTPVLKKIPHPNYSNLKTNNDIGLLHVRSVPMKVFCILSSVDYSTLLGRSVVIAGYGSSQKQVKYKISLAIQFFDQKRPLQLGEGVVTSCKSAYDNLRTLLSLGPFMCVTPKCSKNQQVLDSGDSGGPLFCDNKVVGVNSWILVKRDMPVMACTPISPFLSWINQVINT